MLTRLRTPLTLFICLALGGGIIAAEPKERANALAKPSRNALTYLATAKDEAAKEHYSDAVVELRKVLDPAEGDGFLPLDSLYGSQRTVKREAIRLLDALPPAGRQLYELQANGEVETAFWTTPSAAATARPWPKSPRAICLAGWPPRWFCSYRTMLWTAASRPSRWPGCGFWIRCLVRRKRMRSR